MRSRSAIVCAQRLVKGAALLPALLAVWGATPALAAESPSPPGTGTPAPGPSEAPPTVPPTPAQIPPAQPPSTPQLPTAAPPPQPPPPPTPAPQPAAVAPPPAPPPTPAPPAVRTPVPAATPAPEPIAAPAAPAPTPAPTATPVETSRPVPTIPVPQTNTAPSQQAAPAGGFGRARGALDTLEGFWLPAALVLLVLLAGAAFLLWPRRRRSATLWTEEGGWVSIPDARAATLDRFQLTDAAAHARVPEEDGGPAPGSAADVPLEEPSVPVPPAAEGPPDEPPVPAPFDPVAESAVRPLVPSLAVGATPAAATSAAGVVAPRSAAGPTPSRPASMRPRHRPELKVNHRQTGGPPEAGPPHSPAAALRRFVEDWSGVPLETDGDPHPSMALLRAYAGQVLGGPPLWGAPVEIPDTYDMDHYAWVRESPYRVPSPGDAVVWTPRPEDAHDGGHVAIFIEGDASGFDAFDAAGSAPAVRHHADYRDVVGWLHPIGG